MYGAECRSQMRQISRTSFDVTSLRAGVYILVFSCDEEVIVSKKIVVF